MRSKIPKGHPLRKLFDGVVEQVFMTEVGICDPRLTGYLSAMLSDFVHVDAIYRFHTVDGDAIRDVSRLHVEAYLGPDVAGTERTRLINRFIGDFTLFWTGVFPEMLRPRLGDVDRLHVYLAQGKQSYGIAGELSHDDANPPGELLRTLAEEFENCVHGLHLVRESWQRISLS